MRNQQNVRLGVVGGGFGADFFFDKHPDCTVTAVSALLPAERKKLQEAYRCSTAYSSLADMLKDPAVDAVALFTPAPDHAKHSLLSLEAGKHVLCAVPVGMTMDECIAVKRAVARSGLTYMLAETSVYRPETISAKQFYREGQFGRLIAAEAEYHHPGLEKYFFDSDGNPTWRYGFAPMKYITHCTAFLLAVTRAPLTHVSCLGWGDDSPILKRNSFDNPFWNATALFNSKDKIPFKVNVSWKGALMPTERCEWHGEKMSFYGKDPRGLSEMVVRDRGELGYDDAGFLQSEPVIEAYDQPIWWKTDMLPKELRIPSGHAGSHTFITNEFINSIIEDRRPEIDIEQAIAYTIPGIVAHESALKGGENLTIPEYNSL